MVLGVIGKTMNTMLDLVNTCRGPNWWLGGPAIMLELSIHYILNQNSHPTFLQIYKIEVSAH
jgi:hypothetical protein